MTKFWLLAILIIGAFFRFYGLNWDQEHHLHPDERFLTMVGNAMKVPETLFAYLAPHLSTFNPPNIGFSFFVYGIFPLTLNKILAVLLNNDNYNAFTIQGRFLSGLCDLLVVLVLYKTAELFERKYKLHSSIKYLSSFFYAIAVLPIQLSHFFAVDTFLNLFMFASFYFALRFSITKHFVSAMLSAIFLGLATASKISAVFILPLNIFFLLFLQGRTLSTRKARPLHRIMTGVLLIFLYILISYFSIRIADPYLFENSNFLDPTLNTLFSNNIKALKSFEGKDVWYPPALQWMHKPPVIFSLANLAFFGVGLPYFIFILIGVCILLRKYRYFEFFAMTFWVVIFFLYQSTQFVKSMRYFIFLYPFLAVFAGIGFYYLTRSWDKVYKILAITLILVSPLMFLSIYTKQHVRVEASEWIYQNLEDKSVILGEHWDDSLPLPLPNNYGKFFLVEQFPVFDPDTQEKWQKMNAMLQGADYLVLSSNRGWGSIPTVSEKYPLMSKFYEDLFTGKKQYKKIKEFTSYPSLKYLGIPLEFSDDWADESFTVYDHPRVIIFKKE